MNYDEYLSQEQYKHDSEKNYQERHKVYLVVIDQEEIVCEDTEEWEAILSFTTEVNCVKDGICEASKIERGWIWNTDLNSDFYKHFNTTETWKFL